AAHVQHTAPQRAPASSWPAASSWQDLFSCEVGDGGVGQPQVDLRGPVPRDRFVRAGVVVLDAVVLRALNQGQGVGDVVEEEPFVLQRPESAFAGPVLTG